MEMNKPRAAVSKRFGIALVLCQLFYVCNWWLINPIRLHQKVQVAGVTVPVPFGWIAQITSSQADTVTYVNLRRAFIPFRPSPWIMVSFSRGSRGPYTIGSAQQQLAGMYQGPHYTSQRTFNLSSGKYHSLCKEAAFHGPVPTPNNRGGTPYSDQVLTCVVVGTPLLFDFMSPGAVDADAEKMLTSLS